MRLPLHHHSDVHTFLGVANRLPVLMSILTHY